MPGSYLSRDIHGMPALLIKQARKMGLNNLFLGGDGWDPRILSYAG